jgi:hypothetical protein
MVAATPRRVLPHVRATILEARESDQVTIMVHNCTVCSSLLGNR